MVDIAAVNSRALLYVWLKTNNIMEGLMSCARMTAAFIVNVVDVIKHKGSIGFVISCS